MKGAAVEEMWWVDADDGPAYLHSIPDRLNERHYCFRTADLQLRFSEWGILGGAEELPPSFASCYGS